MTAALPNRIPNDSARYLSGDPRQRLIVALDVSTAAAAQKIVAAVGDSALTYKVGMQLYTAVGPQVVRDLVVSGRRVFLDLKYHDIPNTVGAAVAEAEKLGVSMLTVHAAGSGRMLRLAVEAAKVRPDLTVLAVTVLTSMDQDDIAEMGYTGHTVEQLVLFRARKALEAGCDGVIASGLEVKKIKELTQSKLLVVTPGIREDDAPVDDQKRRTTARNAISEGADYLVVGRPITAVPDPRAGAEQVLQSMQSAFDAVLV